MANFFFCFYYPATWVATRHPQIAQKILYDRNVSSVHILPLTKKNNNKDEWLQKIKAGGGCCFSGCGELYMILLIV